MSEGSRGRGVGRILLPVRRFVARFALVDQERDRRVEQTRKDVGELEDRIRTDLDRLRQAVERTQQENAAILRLLSGTKAEPEAVGPAKHDPVTIHAVFTEVERGSRAEVIEKLGPYVEVFPTGPVCDLGCGRGEFLELARARGLESYGVDSDPESVAACRANGLDARQEDLFDHLRGLSDGVLGGVFCSQVVEHLPPDLIPDLLGQVYRVLRPGGSAVVETPNPATFATHVQSFWRDPTHVRPVPEPALSFAARAAGLVVEDVVFASRVPDQDRLTPLPTDAPSPEVQALAARLNGLIEQLNDLLYGYQDYALVLRKPES
jgi:SAM-dependent methyltransferase